MANVAHADLTGADLHEPKGADTAAADKVYVSNGTGSGTWQKITSSQLDSTADPFSGALLHIEDQKAAGTNGGTNATGAWTTRTLNTSVTNEIAGASLASNQITLPAGTYWCDISSPYFRCNEVVTRLYNVTDGATTLAGTPEYSNYFAYYTQCRSIIKGRFTLAGSKALAVQYYSSSAFANQGLGYGYSAPSLTHTYTQVLIWKIA